MNSVKKWVDPFIVGLVLMLILGLTIPVSSGVLDVLSTVGTLLVGLLFFLYGARLATAEVLRALSNWRLQGAMLVCTFVIFPLLGIVVSRLVEPWIGLGFAAGILYLSLLPSTIQSAVVFVSVARGNVAGAISGSTASNILALFLTPVLVMFLMPDVVYDVASGAEAAAGSVGLDRMLTVLYGLLLPFIVGQLVQPWIGQWVRSRKMLTTGVDRGTILFLVLTAVASATAAGTWVGLSVWTIVALVGIAAALLTIMLHVTWFGGKLIGLGWQDRIALLDCGSTKSLATGLPMAGVLLPAALLGAVAVPLILFHQIQLITCSIIARRLATKQDGN